MVTKTIVPFSRLLLVLGVTFFIMSFHFPGGLNISEWIEPGNFEGEYFLVTEDLYLRAFTNSGNNSFSFYVLDYEDMILALEAGDINGTHPLLVFENVEEYAGLVHFPSVGTYGLFVTHPYNETLIVRFYAILIPRPSFLYLGIVLSLPFVIVTVFNIYQKKISQK